MNRVINLILTLDWLINGIYCKLLNYVPRHTEIVSKLLNHDLARELTILIGFSEVLMATWILSKWQSKRNAWTQIGIVLTMNIIEFSFASELLLWGKLNLVFAFIFCLVVYYNEFVLMKKST
jgi:hypothetical protein